MTPKEVHQRARVATGIDPRKRSALERLERKWRKRAEDRDEQGWVTLVNCANELRDKLATLRAQLAGRDGEAVATTLVGDPEDEREGPWFSLSDWKRLRELAIARAQRGSPPATVASMTPPTGARFPLHQPSPKEAAVSDHELKPCPFCGKAVATLSNTNELSGRPDISFMHTVVCNAHKGGCGTTVGYAEGQDEAIAAWNRRDLTAGASGGGEKPVLWQYRMAGGSDEWRNCEGGLNPDYSRERWEVRALYDRATHASPAAGQSEWVMVPRDELLSFKAWFNTDTALARHFRAKVDNLIAAAPQPQAAGDDSDFVRATTPEEDAAIDLAAGLVKVTVRLPIELAERLKDEAAAVGLVFPAYVRQILFARTPPAHGDGEVANPYEAFGFGELAKQDDLTNPTPEAQEARYTPEMVKRAEAMGHHQNAEYMRDRLGSYELAVDARRYRWLRENADEVGWFTASEHVTFDFLDENPDVRVDLDAAIDTAMAARGEGES